MAMTSYELGMEACTQGLLGVDRPWNWRTPPTSGLKLSFQGVCYCCVSLLLESLSLTS